MNKLIKDCVVDYNTVYKQDAERIREFATDFKNTLTSEQLVGLYKEALFTNATSALPLVMHSIAFAHTLKPENKGTTITDFQNKVRESILNDPKVSPSESARITCNIYLNTDNIDPVMKRAFMKSFIEAQKGTAFIGFREEARKNGDLNFFEEIKGYAFVVAVKNKENMKNEMVSKLSSSEPEQPVVSRKQGMGY